MTSLYKLLPLLCQAGEIDVSGQQGRGYNKEYPGAPKPPVYFNLRCNHSEELFAETAKHLLLTVRQITADVMPSHICGMPGPGQSFARFVAEHLGLPLIVLQKEDGSELKYSVSGESAQASHDNEVLIIDNITCRVRKLMRVVRTLRDLNYQVVRFVAFVDLPHARDKGVLDDIGLTGSFVASVDELLVMLVKSGQITPEQHQAYKDYPDKLAEFFDWMSSIDL